MRSHTCTQTSVIWRKEKLIIYKLIWKNYVHISQINNIVTFDSTAINIDRVLSVDFSRTVKITYRKITLLHKRIYVVVEEKNQIYSISYWCFAKYLKSKNFFFQNYSHRVPPFFGALVIRFFSYWKNTTYLPSCWNLRQKKLLLYGPFDACTFLEI